MRDAGNIIFNTLGQTGLTSFSVFEKTYRGQLTAVALNACREATIVSEPLLVHFTLSK